MCDESTADISNKFELRTSNFILLQSPGTPINWTAIGIRRFIDLPNYMSIQNVTSTCNYYNNNVIMYVFL